MPVSHVGYEVAAHPAGWECGAPVAGLRLLDRSPRVAASAAPMWQPNLPATPRSTDRAHAPANGLSLAGIAATYNTAHASTWPDADIDLFLPGCFEKFIHGGGDTAFHRMHVHSKTFGTTRDGSLILQDTSEGLLFQCGLDVDDAEACTLFRDVADNKLSTASVAFCATEYETRRLPSGRTARIISEALLGEISAVDVAAVPGTKTVAALDARRIELSSSTRLAAFAHECANAQ